MTSDTTSQSAGSQHVESNGTSEASFSAPLTVTVYVQCDDVQADEEGQQQRSNSGLASQTHNVPVFPLLPADVRSMLWDEWFTRWLVDLDPRYSPIDDYELTLRLTNDLGIQALNAEYRNHDCPTDVLAFATIDSPYEAPIDLYEANPYYLGDLVISLETAYIQAQDAGHSLTAELAWLASHGLLHLLGWDHPDEKSLKSMLDKQRTLLSLIDLAGISE